MDRSELSLQLDEQLMTALQAMAEAQSCSVEVIALDLLRRALKAQAKPGNDAKLSSALKKSARAGASAHAPLDDFLPEGVDPFAPAALSADSRMRSGASSFADVQTRMRFAGTPSLLRDYLPDVSDQEY